jgi:hypothetical protein
MEKQQQMAVENFLNSLNMEMPMINHFRNAMRDAILYEWGSSVVVAIMSGIEDAYKSKEQ